MTHPLHILAGRVEGLSGPCRDVDFAIAELLDERIRAELAEVPDFRSVVQRHAPYPAYTASLDAAMSLVPGGWWVQHLGHCLTGWHARLETNGPPSCSIGVGFGKDHTPATAPLALTAASLRTIAANQENGS